MKGLLELFGIKKKKKTPPVDPAIERLRLEKDRLEGLANTVRTDAVMTKAPANANAQEILAAGVEVARTAVINALGDRDTRTGQHVNTARGLLPDVRSAITRAEQAAAARLEKDRLEGLANAVRNDVAMTKVPVDATPEEILAAGVAAARTAVTDALGDRDSRTEQHVNTARGLLDQVRLAIAKAEDAATKRIAEAAYNTRFQEFVNDYSKIRKILDAPGIPDEKKEAFYKAEGEVGAAQKTKDWVTAKTKLDDLERATSACKLIYTAGSAYFTKFATIKANYDLAVQALGLKVNKLALPSKKFLDAWKIVNKAATGKPPDWVKARAGLDALDAAAIALKDAAGLVEAEKPAFDEAFGKVLNLATAQAIATSPPKRLKAAVKTFSDAYEAVNDARNKGDFTIAKDAVPALKQAITDLLAAKATDDSNQQAFKQAMLTVPDYAQASELAAANSKAVAAKIGAFNSADGAVETQKKAEKWPEATALVPALKDAVEKLIEARNQFDAAMTPEKKNKFNEKIKKLKSRTDEATAAGATTHIEGLKQAVRDRLAAVNSLESAGNYADAGLELDKLPGELGKMEKAITEYDAHLKKFNAAKKGAVAKARAAALTPPKLAGERTKALAASEARIKKFAAKGKITKANQLIEEWLNEAKAWEKAQAASDNLNTGANPDEAALNALASLPGGGKVLDALMDGIPEGKPEKFLKDALKIRYGITVTQFEKKNPDSLQDYTGLTPISPDAPDKSLKKMYQMFGKVPLSHVKGKVKDLIQFDEDAGGAAATSDKIWMYCGRPDDPKGSKQRFSEEGVIVPPGEEVDKDFQPTKTDEIPYFDFAALHEVGHVVDAAEGIMSGDKKDIAGWQSHTPDQVAGIAAAHFKYNLQFVKDTLANKDSTPPTTLPAIEGGVTQEVWDAARKKVVEWCQLVREGNSLWNNASLSKTLAISGRVYQEAYFGRPWVSYEFEARSKGITGYQFRAPGEWFAELYAAYFSHRLKPAHPYAAWLKPLKKIT